MRIVVVGNLACKALTTLVVSTLLSLTGCGENIIDYPKYFDLKGNVRVIELKASVVSDTIQSSYLEIWTFNEKRQLLKQDRFSMDYTAKKYKFDQSTVYLYEDGLLRFEETVDSVGIIRLKYEIVKHDNRGFPLEYNLVEGNNAADRMKISYYSDSTKMTSFSNDLAIDNTITFYDKKKNVVREKLEWVFESDTTTSYMTTFDNLDFDAQGNWTKRTKHQTDLVWNQERKIIYF